jgi:hypothetical protein
MPFSHRKTGETNRVHSRTPMLVVTVAFTATVAGAAPTSGAPQPETPPRLQPSVVGGFLPPSAMTIESIRRVDALVHQVRRQRRIIRKLQHSLRSSVDTTGGLARAFLCIHSFEGAWTDAGGPYWGGLQFDATFMSTYGAAFLRVWGTADHWPAFVQVAVAENAYLSGRGFLPWPTTARLCGLL